MVAGMAKAPTEGLTLGLRQLAQAQRCVVMVTGAHKAAVLRAALLERVSRARPASVLRKEGADVLFVVDGPAASQLRA